MTPSICSFRGLNEPGQTFRRLSLRAGAVRGAGAAEARGPRLQLLDLFEDRVPALDRLESELQAALGRGLAHRLRIQYRDGQAPVLRGMRHQVVLCSALASRRLQRERP